VVREVFCGKVKVSIEFLLDVESGLEGLSGMTSFLGNNTKDRGFNLPPVHSRSRD